MCMKRLLALFSVAAMAACSHALNPIIPEGEFFSDPAPRVGPDGTLWIFGSRDENINSWCSAFNDVIETRDLVDFKLHKGVLASIGDADAIPGSNSLLYAPDAIFHNGKWHIFYCMPDKNHREGVVDASIPTGPYTGSRKITECNAIDPSIFRDDDGTLYYNWGQFALSGAVFKPDLSGIDPATVHNNIINEGGHNFHEGIQLTKRNGIYYLVFADIGRRRTPTCIGYATSDKPFGPYVYRGVIIDNYGCDAQSWNNHGGIFEYNGHWYVLYHRSTNGTRYLRKACMEPIAFDENGFIAEVEMTSNGAGPELDPYRDTPARIACVLSGKAHIKTLTDKHERLSGLNAGDTATWRYFNFSRAPKELVMRIIPKVGGFVELRDAKGASYGIAKVPSGNGEDIKEIRLPLTRPFPLGRTAVVLGFNGKQNSELFELDSFIFQ